MTSPFPNWWLIVTGIFAITNIIFFAVLTVLMLRVLNQVQILMPKVQETVEKVNDTVEKVSKVAENVNEIAINTKKTIDEVGQKTKNVATSAESIAGFAAGQISGLGPVIKYGMIALRIFQTWRGAKKTKSQSVNSEPKALP